MARKVHPAVEWEEYHGAGWQAQDRYGAEAGDRRKSRKRYRKWTKQRRAARVERLRRYHNYTEEWRREHGTSCSNPGGC
jgi:hypothetical protein